MLSLLLGLLLICASAAGWLLIGLVVVDVLRQSHSAKAWRTDAPQEGNLP